VDGGVFGRDAELAAADRFLDVAKQRLAVLEIVGDPGIGKTTVWRAVAERAAAHDFVVLRCRPAATETKLALSAVADLLEPVPRDAVDALPEPQRRAFAAALLREHAKGAPPEPRTLGTAVRSILAKTSDDRPVIVAIDDAQWLDRASAMMLGFALRRLLDRRVSWLFATRPVLPRELGVDRLDSLATRIELGPLSLRMLHHVIARQLERPITRSMLVRAHERSGGNPFYAIEIARALARAPVAAEAPMSPTLRAILVKQLRAFPAETRQSLLVASAMSHPTTDVIGEGALGVAEEDDLVRIDSAGKIVFRHPLLRSAVYESAPSARRRQVHAWLAERSVDDEERARHLAAASSDADETIARMLELGAERARGRGAWTSAAELLERAARLTPREHADEFRRRLIVAADHHVHGGDRRHARALAEEVLGGEPSRVRRADALRLLAEIHYNDENYPAAVSILREALELADDPRLAIAIELRLAYTASTLMDFEGGLAHAHRAFELAAQAGEPGEQAEALGYIAIFAFLAGRGLDWAKVERALELEDPARVVPIQSRPTVIAAYLRLFTGDHAEARERMHAIWKKAVEEGDESDLAFVLLWLSWLETRCGNLEVARQVADEAVILARLTGSRSMEAWAGMQVAYVGAHSGDVEQVRWIREEGVRLVRETGNELFALWVAAAQALFELSRGDHAAAWRPCEPLVSAVEARGIGEPVPLFFLPDALEALIGLGHLDRAAALLGVFERRARELDRPWALVTAGRCKALLLAANGDPSAALDAAETAITEHTRIDLPFDRARTLLVRGVIERRLRRRARAKASFEEALDEFERIGAPLWAERARTELGRLGLRRAPAEELTESERRVAELTAKGMTRRQVSRAAFVSPKTVDATLVRVYRKLGYKNGKPPDVSRPRSRL